MTAKALFQFKNLDSTQDLNARFQDLFGKGVYAGGRFAVVSGAYSISVTPYSAMTLSGMAVFNDEPTTISLSGTGLQYIVIDAIYNASGPASIRVFATTADSYNVYRSRYILLGTVDMDNLQSGSGYIDATRFSYSVRDQISPVQDSKFLGHFNNNAARAAALPDTVPTRQRIGDFTVVGTTDIAIGFWTTNGWQDHVDPAHVGQALVDHINDASMHTSLDQHAALSGTSGTPSATNRFVTESDDSVLTDAERYAISHAVGATTEPVGQDNVLVSQRTVIAVPRVFQIAIPSATDYVDLTLASLGVLAPFLVYLGKQGISAGISSAQQYFGIEDSYGAGYVSTLTNYPVYVTNVLDRSNGTVNPSSVSDDFGFFGLVDANAGIRLRLSTQVPANTRLFVRFNVYGDLRSMTPNWSGDGQTFLPAITAFRNAKQAFVGAQTADFDSLTVGSVAANHANMFFSTTTGNVVNTAGMALRNGTDQDMIGEGFKFTRKMTGERAGDVNFTLRATSFYFSAVPDGAPITSGFSFDDTNGFRVFEGGLWIGTAHDSGFDATGTLIAQQGNSAHPSMLFGRRDVNGVQTGIAGLYAQDGLDIGAFTMAKSLALMLGGRTAVVFSSNPMVGVSELDNPLVIHQELTGDGTKLDTLIGPVDSMVDAESDAADTKAARISFGTRSYVGDWRDYLNIDFANAEIGAEVPLVGYNQFLGRNQTTVADELLPSFAFKGARTTGMFFVDSLANSDNGFAVDHGIGFAVAGKAAFVIARAGDNDSMLDDLSAPLVLTQRVFNGINNKVLYYDFATTQQHRDNFDHREIRFGATDFSGSYSPVFGVDGYQALFYRSLVTRASIYFGGSSTDDATGSNLAISQAGIGFRGTSTATGRGIYAVTGGMWLGKGILASADAGFFFDDLNGITASGTLWLRNATSAPSTRNQAKLAFGGSVLGRNTGAFFLKQNSLSSNLLLSLGQAPSTQYQLQFGYTEATGVEHTTAVVSADGVFRAGTGAAVDDRATLSFYDVNDANGNINRGLGYNRTRDVVDMYGDFGLHSKLKMYQDGVAVTDTSAYATMRYDGNHVRFDKPVIADLVGSYQSLNIPMPNILNVTGTGTDYSFNLVYGATIRPIGGVGVAVGQTPDILSGTYEVGGVVELRLTPDNALATESVIVVIDTKVGGVLYTQKHSMTYVAGGSLNVVYATIPLVPRTGVPSADDTISWWVESTTTDSGGTHAWTTRKLCAAPAIRLRHLHG